MGRVVIAGCGYVGTRLGEILVEEGHEVWGIRRNPRSLPSSINPIPIDLNDPGRLTTADLSCDFAVYCAAADGHTEEAYEAAYVIGFQNFLARLKECSPDIRHVFFTSSTGVYGQNDGSWVDEGSPTEPESFSGRKVLEGEQVLLNSGLPATVIRFGGIYGPGRTRLLDMVRNRNVVLTKSRAFTNRIHREDCARSVAHLLKIENPKTLYNGVDCDPCDRNEVYTWLANRLGVDLDPADGSTDSTPTGKRCRNDRLIESGYEFSYPSFREGYTEMIVNRREREDRGEQE